MKHVRTHYSTPENAVLKQLTLKASMQKLKRLSSHNKFYQAVSVEKTKFSKRELSCVLLAEGICLLLIDATLMEVEKHKVPCKDTNCFEKVNGRCLDEVANSLDSGGDASGVCGRVPGRGCCRGGTTR